MKFFFTEWFQLQKEFYNSLLQHLLLMSSKDFISLSARNSMTTARSHARQNCNRWQQSMSSKLSFLAYYLTVLVYSTSNS